MVIMVILVNAQHIKQSLLISMITQQSVLSLMITSLLVVYSYPHTRPSQETC
jgi:hypothetical protein